MRILLILWLVPVFLLTGWYGLSYHDINMGTALFSRQMHDLVFQLYGNILGVDPDAVPMMAAKAIALDSLIVLGIIAFRLRKSWWPAVSRMVFGSEEAKVNTLDADADTARGIGS